MSEKKIMQVLIAEDEYNAPAVSLALRTITELTGIQMRHYVAASPLEVIERFAHVDAVIINPYRQFAPIAQEILARNIPTILIMDRPDDCDRFDDNAVLRVMFKLDNFSRMKAAIEDFWRMAPSPDFTPTRRF